MDTDQQSVSNATVTYTFAYDAKNRLLAKTDSRAGKTLTFGYVTNLGYTHDRVGHITQASGLFGAGISDTRAYTYDARYRLTNVSSTNPTYSAAESFTYDAVGNRQTHTAAGQLRTYQYVANSNRLSTVRLGGAGGTIEKSFTYDDEGRLTAQTGQGAKTLTWDQKGRATQMIAGVNTNLFQYDPMDYRIQRTGDSLGNRDYYLEGEHLEAEYANGTLQWNSTVTPPAAM